MNGSNSCRIFVQLILLILLPAGFVACRPEGPAAGADPAAESAADRHDANAGAEHAAGEHDEHHEEDGIVELAPEAIARIGLATSPVALHALDARRRTTGQIGFDENRLAHVGSRVGGRLIRVDGELGERVEAGEPLAVVDSVELGEACAAFLRARARSELAAKRFERQSSLYRDRIVSEQQALEAEAATREAASDLAAARETLLLLGLEAREIDGLSWGDPTAAQTIVRAPFAGRVIAREATVGELITPEQVLYEIADLSEVWLWVDLYERDLAHVRRAQRAEVRLDAWPGEVFTGELTYLADELDQHTRMVRARVDLPNPERRLKPGMFARVDLRSTETETHTALAVPRAAVQRDGEESIVFVRTTPGRFERREVVLGRVTGELVEIVSGLAAGEEVVVEGAFLLRSQARADQLGGHHH
jgi:cobalt-zinc-cadmium efflux system membrane fusion protein